MANLYDEADKFFVKVVQILDKYGKSHILQDYLINVAKSLFYANIIKNFFDNLKPDNIIKLDLPVEKIAEIKIKYDTFEKDTNDLLSDSLQKSAIDQKYYNSFKSNLTKDFPEFLTILSQIECQIGIDKADDYFDKKRKELETTGKSENDINETIMTSLLEAYVQRENRFPIEETEVKKMMNVFTENLSKPLSDNVIANLKKDAEKMLKEQREYEKGFEARLYNRWKVPIDLMESLIRISMESGSKKWEKLANSSKTGQAKASALIQIHARALSISNEILSLIKSGYADGANARWRSLLELGVIAFFLKDNTDDIAQRYLDNVIIRKYKESRDYQEYHKRLGEEPLEDQDLVLLKNQKDSLIKKYGEDFDKKDYNWIPYSVLRDRNFRGLIKHVKLDHFLPYYNFSTNSIHGSSRGFHRLGLTNKTQEKILLAGASDYGHADPLQNTALLLSHVTMCLLLLESDFESMLNVQIMNRYFKEIGETASKIQKEIEKEEEEMLKD